MKHININKERGPFMTLGVLPIAHNKLGKILIYH